MHFDLFLMFLTADAPDVHTFASEAPHDRSKLNLSCLATGFYPKHIEMKITLNNPSVEPFSSTGVRPNDDETFQMRISVEIHREEEESYECHVSHSSLTQTLITQWGKYESMSCQNITLIYDLLTCICDQISVRFSQIKFGSFLSLHVVINS